VSGRVRNHRRVNRFAEGASALAVIAFVCGGGVAVLAALSALGGHLPGVALLVVPGTLLVGRTVRRRQRLRRAVRARGELAEWAGPAGWTAVPVAGDRGWPWTGLQVAPDVAVVLSAYTKRVVVFPVTVGEIRWHNRGLGTTVERAAGSGLFVLVVLPQPVESMAVRCYPDPARRRAGEDEFRRRFETRGFDSYRLDSSELRAAHVNGDVPLWTVIGRDLFAFVPLSRPPTPDAVDLAVQRTLRVVRLMEFGPDGPVTPGATGPSGAITE
jgi:hypothetical protein